MKKFLKLFLLSFIALCLIGCPNPNTGNPENPSPKPEVPAVDPQAELKQKVYNYFLGSWEINPYSIDYVGFEKITFKENSIILEDNEIPFNPLDMTLVEWENKKCFTTRLNGTHYEIIYYIAAKLLSICDLEIGSYTGFEKVENGSDNTGNESSALDFSVTGDWNYKMNGMIDTVLSLNEDGSFSFSKTSSNYTGTYSLSGNKITFEYEASTAYNTTNTKDTFTVSGNENEITLSLVESVTVVNGQESTNTSMSSMLNQFYSIVTSTSITLTK